MTVEHHECQAWSTNEDLAIHFINIGAAMLSLVGSLLSILAFTCWYKPDMYGATYADEQEQRKRRKRRMKRKKKREKEKRRPRKQKELGGESENLLANNKHKRNNNNAGAPLVVHKFDVDNERLTWHDNDIVDDGDDNRRLPIINVATANLAAAAKQNAKKKSAQFDDDESNDDESNDDDDESNDDEYERLLAMSRSSRRLSSGTSDRFSSDYVVMPAHASTNSHGGGAAAARHSSARNSMLLTAPGESGGVAMAAADHASAQSIGDLGIATYVYGEQTVRFRGCLQPTMESLIIMLQAGDLLAALGIIVSHMIILFNGQESVALCKFIRAWIEGFYTSTFFWTCVIGWALWRQINGRIISQREYLFYQIVCWGVPPVFMIIVELANGFYVTRGGWCSLSSAFIWIFWFTPLLCSITVTLVLYIFIFRRLRQNFGGFATEYDRVSELQRVISLILLAFVLCWFLDIVEHILSSVGLCTPFWLNAASDALSPLNGFLNFVLYTLLSQNVHWELSRLDCSRWRSACADMFGGSRHRRRGDKSASVGASGGGGAINRNVDSELLAHATADLGANGGGTSLHAELGADIGAAGHSRANSARVLSSRYDYMADSDDESDSDASGDDTHGMFIAAAAAAGSPSAPSSMDSIETGLSPYSQLVPGQLSSVLSD
jgi:7 transmembrane receptor (Secretin family)